MDWALSKGKGSPPLKGCRKTLVKLDEINIIFPHMKYEVVDYNWRTLWAPRNERCEDGRDRETFNHDEGNQHPRISKAWLGNLLEKCEDSNGSLKRWRPLTTNIIGRYVNIYAGSWSLQEDVIGKRPSPKGNMWFVFGIWSLGKFWVCVQDQGKESWHEGCHNYVPCESPLKKRWRQMALWRKLKL